MLTKILAIIKSTSLATKFTSIVIMAIVVGGRIITTVISSQYLNRLRVISSIKQENQNEESQIQNVEPQTSELNDQPKQPQTKQPSKPTSPKSQKTCSELQNCDFNLNTRYVIETDKFNFYNLPEGVTDICQENESGHQYLDILPIVETKTFYQIGNFTGKGGRNRPHVTPTRTEKTFKQADNYATAKNLYPFHDGWGCGGMGDIIRDWTWQETIDKGFALNETKCTTWNLSCGRW